MTTKGKTIDVVDLRDKHGKVVGYAAGCPEETAAMAQAVWSSPQVSGSAIEALRSAMTARVQDARRAAETKGVLVGGNVFATDIASQVKYVAALLHCMRTPGFETSWKTINNGYVTMDAGDIATTCATVMEYIQTCYAWDQSMLAKIAASTTFDALRTMDLDEGRPAGCLTKSIVMHATKLRGEGAPPAATKGDGAGSKARVSLSEGSTDTAGQLTVAAAGIVNILPGSTIATVKFSSEYDSAPFVVMQPASNNSATLKFQPFVTTTKSEFTLSVSGTGVLAASKEYVWNYVIIQ